MNSLILYPFAYDENNNLVFIKDAVKGQRGEHTYRCPGCGQPMNWRNGATYAPHFYHSGDQKCGLESYVHKVAKEILANKFNDRTKPFKIEFSPNIQCKETESCKYEKHNCFCWATPVTYDLHKHYDLPAEEEMRVVEEDGKQVFVADVLLKSSDPNWKDVLIEVYHTHKSTADKIQSGHRIIEIRLRNLDELKALQSADCIKEADDTVFYNFIRRISPDKVLENRKEYFRECGPELPAEAYPLCQQPLETKRKYSSLRRMTLYKSGKTFNEGIFEEERGIHHSSALMDIVYESETGIERNAILGVMAKFDGRARVCDLCGHCVIYGFDAVTWCELVKNGSSRKGTFDPMKGPRCQFFEWPKNSPLNVIMERFMAEKDRFTIWINPDNK